jgi:hypothetical protein
MTLLCVEKVVCIVLTKKIHATKRVNNFYLLSMRILGITLPDNKQAQYGLPLFTVLVFHVQKILGEAKIDPVKKD